MEEKKISALKRERLLRGIQQKDLSFKTRISASSISNFEAGRWDPNERDKKLLAEALGVPVRKLFPKE